MNSEYEFRFTVGVMLRKHIRAMLEGERFSGRNIRWLEDKGWLESVFRVRGAVADAKAIESRVDAYAKMIGGA